MQNKTANSSQFPIIWLQVGGLAAVQGAITLTWLIYNLYLSDLFVQLGLSVGLAKGLLIIENAVEAFIEPLSGGISDRAKLWLGSRFPFISCGVITASALFLAIPAVVVFGDATGFLRWLLPGVAFTWAMAMAMFRSPALSLLGRAAPIERLPQAASVLVFVGGIIGAFRFHSYGLILKLGVVSAFGIGSFTLLAAVAFLRWVQPPSIPNTEPVHPQPANKQNLLLIFGTGMGVAWGVRLLMQNLSLVFAQQLGSDRSGYGMLLFSLALALAALPAGVVASRIGNVTAMLLGLGVTTICLQLLAFLPYTPVIVFSLIAIVAAFSLVLNGAIPFALSLLHTTRSGLAIGMYFGGFSAAMSLYDWLFLNSVKFTTTVGAICGVIAFSFAAVCIAWSEAK